MIRNKQSTLYLVSVMTAWSVFPALGVRLTTAELIEDLQISLNMPNTQVQYERYQKTDTEKAGWEKTEKSDNIEDLDFFPDVLISNKFGAFTFPEGTQLSWAGDRVLEMRINGNITFSQNVRLKHSSFRGGLVLKAYHKGATPPSKDAIIDFSTAGSPSLDFSESRGAVSIFYNPQSLKSGDNKYTNPTNFNGLIIKNPSVYFEAFMLVRNGADRELMKNLGTGHYALLNSDVPSKSVEKIPDLFNLNGCGFKWVSYDCPISANYVFEGKGKGTPHWGSRLLYTSPPLYGPERGFIHLLASQKDAEAMQFMKDLGWLNQDGSAQNFAYVTGVDLKTPLHWAAEYGCSSAVNKIFEAVAPPKALGEQFINCPNVHGLSALALAAASGQLGVVQLLVNLYQKNHYFFDANQMVQQIQNKIIDPYSQITTYLNAQALSTHSLSPYWKAFPNSHTANEYEYKSAQEAHRRFFVKNDPSKLSLHVQKAFEQFRGDYLRQNPQSSTLNLNGIPSRSRIILMGLITQEKLKMWDEKKALYWNSHEEDKYPTHYLFGNRPEHKFYNQPTNDKPGSVYYNRIGTYDTGKADSVRVHLTQISTSISPQAIARLTRLSRVSGNPITADTLLEAGYTGNAPEEDANYLNCFILLWDLEVASRLASLYLSQTPTDYDQLPIGIGIARIQQYITAKNELYDKYLENPLTDPSNPDSSTAPGPYHIFTGPASHREEALKKINEELRPISKERRKKTGLHWENDHPLWSVSAAPERFHQELLTEYGGGYESDGDVYFFP